MVKALVLVKYGMKSLGHCNVKSYAKFFRFFVVWWFFFLLGMIGQVKAFEAVPCNALILESWMEINFLLMKRPLPMNKTCSKSIPFLCFLFMVFLFWTLVFLPSYIWYYRFHILILILLCLHFNNLMHPCNKEMLAPSLRIQPIIVQVYNNYLFVECWWYF